MAYQKLSDAEKKQLLKDVFGEKHSSVGQNFPFYSKLIDRLDKFNDIVAIAELLPGVNALASGPGISASYPMLHLSVYYFSPLPRSLM